MNTTMKKLVEALTEMKKDYEMDQDQTDDKLDRIVIRAKLDVVNDLRRRLMSSTDT